MFSITGEEGDFVMLLIIYKSKTLHQLFCVIFLLKRSLSTAISIVVLILTQNKSSSDPQIVVLSFRVLFVSITRVGHYTGLYS